MFLDDFIEISHCNLLQPSSKLPLSYLVSRGVTLKEIKQYKLGFSPSFFTNIDEKDNDDTANFNKWLGWKGRFVKKRIVFPIYDELGNAKGIETRALDRRSMDVLKPKFKESLKEVIASLPESEIRYKKFYLGKNKFTATFFGLPNTLESIWKTRTVFLTEGILDLLTLLKIKPNGISSLTANLNKYQIEWLKRYVDRVILIFDPDKKGRESVDRLKKTLGKELQVDSLSLKGKDINDYMLKYGLTDLKNQIEDKLQTIF